MIGTLLAAVASVNAPRMARRARRAAIDYAIAGVALLVGCGFLLAAAFIWASARWGAFEAALGFGIGFVALGILTLLVHRSVVAVRGRRRAEEEKAQQLRSLATAAAVATVPTLVRQAGLFGIVAIPLAGLAAYAIWRESRRRDPADPD